MQIKMTLRYHFTPFIMVKFKNTEDFLCWRRCGVREHTSTGGESANLYKHFGNPYGDLSENWKSTSKLRYITLEHIPKECSVILSHTTIASAQLCS